MYSIPKSVFLSQSRDIISNLALEHWMYLNMNFDTRHVLFLWHNKPCIVIGRHQNPWVECNIDQLPYIGTNGVKFARRNSGGGAVYHDEGNLNLTFFTNRLEYNRKRNLNLIADTLYRAFNIKVKISDRDDLTFDNCKVSGTASKLGKNAYHHCTLLIDVNKENLKRSLQSLPYTIETNATKSVPAKTINLSEVNGSITRDRVAYEITNEYLSQTMLPSNYITQFQFNIEHNGFQLINPTNDLFPGLEDIRDNLASWTWRFGKTPKFTVTYSFTSQCKEINISVMILHGLVESIMVMDKSFKTVNSTDFPLKEISGKTLADITLSYQGCKFSGELLVDIETDVNRHLINS